MTAASTKAAAEPPASRVERKREERIDRILRAAAQTLAEHGYHNTSLEMVAERLDLTKASLYHYFGSKDELFSACLSRVAQQTTEQMTDIAHTDGSASARLRALVIYQITILTRVEPEMSKLFLQSFEWPESMSTEVRRLRTLHSKPFHDIIDAGLATGEFTPANDQAARHCMFGAINYVPVWFRADTQTGAEYVLSGVADQIVRMFNPTFDLT